MLVLSEFVGCSPSVSGAIRVNPWSVDDVADRIHEVHEPASGIKLLVCVEGDCLRRVK